MGRTVDEDVVRRMLADVTTAQPAPPTDRVTSIRRRHVRRRSAQAGIAVAVAVAVAVGVVVAVPTSGRHASSPLDRPVPSWALPWPEHREASISQRILDGAVSAWRRVDHANPGTVLPAPTSVVWYVAAHAVHGRMIVVAFEAEGSFGRRLVMGYTSANEVDGSSTPQVSDGGTPWILYDAPAPPASYRGQVSVNMAGPAPGTDGTSPDDDWVAMLAPPTADYAYVSPGLQLRLDHGFGTGDAGRVEEGAPLETSVRVAGRFVGGSIGVLHNARSHVPVLGPVGQPTFAGSAIITMSGQGDGRQGEAVSTVGGGHAGQHAAVYVRCSGRGAIHVRLYRSPTSTDPRAGTLGSRPCDGQQYRLVSPPLAPGRHFGLLGVRSSPYAAWTVAVVAR